MYNEYKPGKLTNEFKDLFYEVFLIETDEPDLCVTLDGVYTVWAICYALRDVPAAVYVTFEGLQMSGHLGENYLVNADKYKTMYCCAANLHKILIGKYKSAEDFTNYVKSLVKE